MPGFGGLFYKSANAELSVYLRHPGNLDTQAAVTQAIADVEGKHRVAGKVRFLQSDYTIRQLAQWYAILKQGLGKNRGIWSIPAVTAIDLAEGRNRLFVGVEDLGASGQVEEMVRELGIPREAVTIGYLGRPEPVATKLTDAVHPAPGGVQVVSDFTGAGGPCTVGFVTIHNDSDPGMMTASHCTLNIWTVDQDPFYQPTADSIDNWIGNESLDPGGFSSSEDPDCPSSDDDCRYSDAAFVDDAGNAGLEHGFIAKPVDSNTGELVIDPDDPRFRIVAEDAALEGDTMSKVGRSSGWSTGPVTDTCVLRESDTPGRWYVCQNVVDLGWEVKGGDSGSPVFRWSQGSTDVALVGLLWGRDPQQTNLGWFSDLGLLYFDFGGTWDSCEPSFGC